jgi:intein-encoded DNA endonuclease-like protein
MTWEYIAGFFDGEGSLVHNGKGYRITISQTNYEVLDKIKSYAGIGYIFQNKKRKAHWKESWVYYIAKQEDVYYFIKNISPFLIVKRDLATQIIPKLILAIERGSQRKLRLKNNIIASKNLRKRGLTYREIGKKLGIDWGYARRLSLK